MCTYITLIFIIQMCICMNTTLYNSHQFSLYPTVNLHSYTFHYSKIHLCCHFHKCTFADNTCLTIHMYTWTSILQQHTCAASFALFFNTWRAHFSICVFKWAALFIVRINIWTSSCLALHLRNILNLSCKKQHTFFCNTMHCFLESRSWPEVSRNLL